MLDKFRTQKIIWDKANGEIFEKVEAHSGDSNGRKLTVQVLNNGMIENLTDCTLSLAWQTKDKAHFGLDAFTAVDIEHGIFEIYYTRGMLSNVGELRASFVLMDSKSRIESKGFTIEVLKSNVDDDAVQSDNSFTALTEALIKVSKYQDQIDDIKEDIINQGNALISTEQEKLDNLYTEKESKLDTLHQDKLNALNSLYNTEKAELDALEQDYADRATNLETTYAPRLTAVENMEIGGRNYISNTDRVLTLDSPDTFRQVSLGNSSISSDFMDVAEGKEVVLSIEARSTGYTRGTTNPWIGIEFSYVDAEGNVGYGACTMTTLLSDDGNWRRYATKIRVAEGLTSVRSRIAWLIRDIKGYVQTRRPKLEIGNKATDWTPAPEDIQAEINKKANNDDFNTHLADYAKHSARIYNAANYGLDGEGINAAITDAYNNGGGTVIIDGIFNVDDENIILKPNVSLVGLPGNKINLTNRVILTDGQPYEFNCVIEGLNLGHEDTISLDSPIEIVGLDAANKCSNVIIRDNVIKCDERGVNGIKTDYAEKIEIYNNAIYDTGQGCGILIKDSLNVDVYNNKVYNSGRAGIQVFANCEYIRIHDNYVYSWMLRREILDGGIDSYGPYNSHISVYNNIVDTGTEQAMGGARNHTLIRMQGVHGCYVKNNILIVQSPTVDQVMRLTNRDESEISDGVVFEGNEIYLKTDAQYIFRGHNTKDWTIRNNKVYSLGGVCSVHIIEVRNDIEELLIDGNEFKDDLTKALISVYHTGVKLSNLRIINNTFINQSNRLAILNNIDYPVDTLMICNNRIETSLGDAIYIYPGIGKLMITNNYVQCGSGGTPIAKKGTLGEGNEIIENNFEVVSSS